MTETKKDVTEKKSRKPKEEGKATEKAAKKQPKDETVEEQKIAEDQSEETPKDKGEEKPEKTEEDGKSEEDENLNSKYMRLMADFQNFKRRTEKEKGDIYAYANEKIVGELLNVIDSFERALEHECADEGYAEGMEMIFKQLTGVLERAGLEEIEALGQNFDPNFHNAVMMEDNDDFESGKVTEVMQKGYKLNNKVIRASMVKVNN